VEEHEDSSGVVTETQSEHKTKRPRMYKALMHNDDYTTREFVVYVLQSVFRKSEQEALNIMMHVHNNGVGIAGVYTREIAETKVKAVERMALEDEFPLRMSIEPNEDSD
jgi:ATP-dependent Clp protease adaptor protein ClpS